MFAFLIAIVFCISEKAVPGSWIAIPVDSEQVKIVQGYLERNLHHLFPELEDKSYEITSAKFQIVNGMNLKLIIKSKSTPLLFEICLYINPDQRVTIADITKPLGARPIMGGYNWERLSRFSEDALNQLIKLIRMKVNLLIQNQARVIVYRTKVENGINHHVIFRDGSGCIFSAITTIDQKTRKEDLVSVYQIF